MGKDPLNALLAEAEKVQKQAGKRKSMSKQQQKQEASDDDESERDREDANDDDEAAETPKQTQKKKRKIEDKEQLGAEKVEWHEGEGCLSLLSFTYQVRYLTPC